MSSAPYLKIAVGTVIVHIMSKTAARRRSPPPPGSLSEHYLQRLDQIEDRAKAVGQNMTTVCKAAKISRAGPVRWRRKVPLSIVIIDKLTKVVEKFEEKTALKTQ